MTMKYFKDTAGTVYAYESDGSQDAWIKPDLVPMSDADAQAYVQSVLDAQAATVPTVVSRAQGKAALIQAGLWQQVLDYVAAITDPTQKALADVALNDTTEWRRDSPFLATVAAGIGLSDQQLDDLFVAAAKIVL